MFPGVAQLVGRLIWVQDAGSSNLPTRTKNTGTAFAVPVFFFLVEGDSKISIQQSGGLLLAASLMAATPYFPHSGKATNLPTRMPSLWNNRHADSIGFFIVVEICTFV